MYTLKWAKQHVLNHPAFLVSCEIHRTRIQLTSFNHAFVWRPCVWHWYAKSPYTSWWTVHKKSSPGQEAPSSQATNSLFLLLKSVISESLEKHCSRLVPSAQWQVVGSIPQLGHTKDCNSGSHWLLCWHSVFKVGIEGSDQPVIPVSVFPQGIMAPMKDKFYIL